MQAEEWRPIVGYEGLYEVSSHGLVRSLDRKDARGWRRKGRVLKPTMDTGGYPVVGLHNGNRRAYTVHTLVAAVFIGPRPPGLDICHNDGDKTNNTRGNLRYGTRGSNRRDCWDHGGSYGKSKYLGVSPHRNKWRAQYWLNGRNHLGLFDTEIEAAREVDKFITDNKLQRRLNLAN